MTKNEPVTAEFTRRATIHVGDTTDMVLDTPEIQAAVAAHREAIAARTARAKAKKFGRKMDEAERAVNFAGRDIEFAVRRANPGAAELQINTAVQSL
jgi:hypothetical protein